MKKFFMIIFIIFILIMIIISPEVCIEGAKKGLLICGNVIIPSLFPFGVFVLFLIKCNFINNIPFINLISKKMFNINQEMFIIMIFSMLGGYPIGARLINELYKNKKISKNNAHIMQCYCVNAGPAFIAVAIGEGIFHSKKMGILLLLAHILSSMIIALFLKRKIKYEEPSINAVNRNSESLSDMFINSTAEAASAVLSISYFVILFSVINTYLKLLSTQFSLFKILSMLCEVTTTVSTVKNIYLISFLLGFSGFAVWFQIVACSKACSVNFPLFITSRIVHGSISVLILYVLLYIFKINIHTISNINFKNINLNYNNLSIVLSLLIMVIMLIISLNGKNHSRNILDDVL